MQEVPQKPTTQWHIIGILSLVASVLVPILSMLKAMFARNNAYDTLGQDGLSSGVGELGGHIGEVLVATAVGGIVSLICLPVGIYCLVKHSRLRKQQREAQLTQSPSVP